MSRRKRGNQQSGSKSPSVEASSPKSLVGEDAFRQEIKMMLHSQKEAMMAAFGRMLLEQRQELASLIPAVAGPANPARDVVNNRQINGSRLQLFSASREQ